MKEDISTILLDIEGTTSSISFVFDVLFPYAKRHMRGFLEANLESEPVCKTLDQMARDQGYAHRQQWLADLSTDEERIDRVVKQACQWMDEDAKLTGLKELQGLIWKTGYDSGELKSHVYPDVPEAMKRWVGKGKTICIYSSGSIGAQKTFFKDTEYGDLTHWITDYFDTTSGPKKEQKSYENILRKIGTDASKVLFLSDITDELKAARQAGVQVLLVVRPGNRTQEES